MDIFHWADSTGWLSDYYDFNTGYIYGVSRTENKNEIPVYDGSVKVGVVKREVTTDGTRKNII